MTRARSSRRFFLLGAGLLAVTWVLAGTSFEAAKVKVKTDRDTTFSFAGLRTWAWDPANAGEVKLAYSADMDPAPIDKRTRPTIFAAVEREFAKRGLQQSDRAPDLMAHYYLLITATPWSQEMGEFAPSVVKWGLPPFTPQTTALEVVSVVTFLLDLAAPGREGLVWRGSAQTEIDLDQSVQQRAKTLDQAISDLFKKFPPTK
jgi:hypothetical protein